MINSKIKTICVIIVFSLILLPATVSAATGTVDTAKNNTARGLADKGDLESKLLLNKAAMQAGNAYATILKFLNRVELSDINGLDYDEAGQLVKRSLNNLRTAIDCYKRVLQIPSVSVESRGGIDKLASFDYESFQRKHAYNFVIFKEVRSYLQKGDSRGIYFRLLGSMNRIEAMLSKVDSELEDSKLPELKNLWRLNEACSDALAFRRCAKCIIDEAK